MKGLVAQYGTSNHVSTIYAGGADYELIMCTQDTPVGTPAVTGVTVNGDQAIANIKDHFSESGTDTYQAVVVNQD